MEEQIAEDVKVRHEPIQEPVTDNFIKTICDLVEVSLKILVKIKQAKLKKYKHVIIYVLVVP